MCLTAYRISIILGDSAPTMEDYGYHQTIHTLVLRKPYPKKCLVAALFKRETLLSSLSEPAAHRSMKEEFSTQKILRKMFIVKVLFRKGAIT